MFFSRSLRLSMSLPGQYDKQAGSNLCVDYLEVFVYLCKVFNALVKHVALTDAEPGEHAVVHSGGSCLVLGVILEFSCVGWSVLSVTDLV